MRIIVFSDSHGGAHCIAEALMMHPEAQAVIHLGDGERDMRADLEALMRHGYTGYVSAETCDGRYYQDPSKATTQVIEMYRRVTAEMEAE